MPTPHLHRQLSQQLRQWIVSEDRRHLEGFGEIVSAILHFSIGDNSVRLSSILETQFSTVY